MRRWKIRIQTEVCDWTLTFNSQLHFWWSKSHSLISSHLLILSHLIPTFEICWFYFQDKFQNSMNSICDLWVRNFWKETDEEELEKSWKLLDHEFSFLFLFLISYYPLSNMESSEPYWTWLREENVKGWCKDVGRAEWGGIGREWWKVVSGDVKVKGSEKCRRSNYTQNRTWGWEGYTRGEWGNELADELVVINEREQRRRTEENRRKEMWERWEEAATVGSLRSHWMLWKQEEETRVVVKWTFFTEWMNDTIRFTSFTVQAMPLLALLTQIMFWVGKPRKRKRR